jgi:hypothetical protein
VTTSLIRSGTSLFWIENVDNQQTVVATIVNAGLAKKSVAGEGLEVSDEAVHVKKALLDMMLCGKEHD